MLISFKDELIIILALFQNNRWLVSDCPSCYQLYPLSFLCLTKLPLFQPQNILLSTEDPDSDIKLCDFGISRIVKKGVEVKEILGTPDYVGEHIL